MLIPPVPGLGLRIGLDQGGDQPGVPGVGDPGLAAVDDVVRRRPRTARVRMSCRSEPPLGSVSAMAARTSPAGHAAAATAPAAPRCRSGRAAARRRCARPSRPPGSSSRGRARRSPARSSRVETADSLQRSGTASPKTPISFIWLDQRGGYSCSRSSRPAAGGPRGRPSARPPRRSPVPRRSGPRLIGSAVDGAGAQLRPQQRQRGLLGVDGGLGVAVAARPPRPRSAISSRASAASAARAASRAGLRGDRRARRRPPAPSTTASTRQRTPSSSLSASRMTSLFRSSPSRRASAGDDVDSVRTPLASWCTCAFFSSASVVRLCRLTTASSSGHTRRTSVVVSSPSGGRLRGLAETTGVGSPPRGAGADSAAARGGPPAAAPRPCSARAAAARAAAGWAGAASPRRRWARAAAGCPARSRRRARRRARARRALRGRPARRSRADGLRPVVGGAAGAPARRGRCRRGGRGRLAAPATGGRTPRAGPAGAAGRRRTRGAGAPGPARRGAAGPGPGPGRRLGGSRTGASADRAAGVLAGDRHPPLEPLEPLQGGRGRPSVAGSSMRAQTSSSSSRGAVVPRISVRPSCTVSAIRDSVAEPSACGLLAHQVEPVGRAVEQPVAAGVGHGVEHDQVAQPVEQVGGEAARVVPGLDHAVDRRGTPPGASWAASASIVSSSRASSVTPSRPTARLVGDALRPGAGEQLVEDRQRVAHRAAAGADDEREARSARP